MDSRSRGQRLTCLLCSLWNTFHCELNVCSRGTLKSTQSATIATGLLKLMYGRYVYTVNRVLVSELALKHLLARIKSLEWKAKRTSVMTQSILASPSDRRKHFSLMDDSCCYLLTRTWSNVPRGVVLKSLPLTLSILGFNEGPGNQMR